MKTKKIWLSSVVVLSVAATIIVTWVCWPEYGKGYSEDQRRNWNEMASWGNGRDYGNEESFLTSRLDRRQSQPDAPVWKLEISPSSVSRLPLEGMSVPVLKHLASGGDARACLELVFRAFDDGRFNFDDVDFCFPDFSCVYQAEMYGKKAQEMGLPGADFLFRLIEARKQKGGDLDVRNMDGYTAFVSLLDQGDFLLGKIYLYLDPQGEHALVRLKAALRRKAEQGNAEALRNLAHLLFLNQSKGELGNGVTFDLYRRSEESAESSYRKVEKGIKWGYDILPIWQEEFKKWDKWLIGRLEAKEWEATKLRLEEPIAMLREAAVGGDLHAKYLWCIYKTVCQQPFSRKEWENYLMYVDEILKAGGIYRGNRFVRSYALAEYFYTGSSIWKVMEAVMKRDKEDSVFLFPGTRVIPNESEMKWAAMVSMENFGDSLCRYISEKEQEYGFNLVEHAAEAGDPYALYYMSKMLNEAFLGKTDGRRAWDSLQKLKIWRNSIKGELSSDDLGQDRRKNKKNISYGCSFSYSVDVQELDIVSRYGDMPGMTVREAFEKFLSMNASADVYPPFNEMLQPSNVKEQFEKRGFKVPDEKK